jgi:hypothetical protein
VRSTDDSGWLWLLAPRGASSAACAPVVAMYVPNIRSGLKLNSGMGNTFMYLFIMNFP